MTLDEIKLSMIQGQESNRTVFVVLNGREAAITPRYSKAWIETATIEDIWRIAVY